MEIYLVMAAGSRRETLARALAGRAVLLDDLAALTDGSGRSPGVVLVDPEVVDAGRVFELAGRRGEGWRVALLLGPKADVVYPISIGASATLVEALAFAQDPTSPPPAFMDLGEVLAEVARTRHDVNNPLTSALAETQLLLLDAVEGEARTSLEVVQEQLRRLRDMVAGTRHLRPPRA